jgi:hypothetical protein
MVKKTIAIIFILMLSITACSSIKSMAPLHPAGEPGDVLFKDDFSESPNGWGVLGREGGEIGFQDNGFVISVDTPQYLFWSVNGDRYLDTKIDVDAVLLEGPTDDNFGVICRFQDNDNFYGFLISHDGYYGIFKVVEGILIMSTPDPVLNYNDTIRQGGIVNHIQAVCQGDVLSLYVNDVLLSQIKDDSFTSGQIGLIAGAYDTAGVKVLFDNLVVTQP